jgi:hypothetical protein
MELQPFALLYLKKNGREATLLSREFRLCPKAELVTLRLVTAYVCAVSRLTVSLAQPGRTQKEVPGSPNQPRAERQKGK